MLRAIKQLDKKERDVKTMEARIGQQDILKELYIQETAKMKKELEEWKEENKDLLKRVNV